MYDDVLYLLLTMSIRLHVRDLLAFGLTGLAATDMLSKLTTKIPTLIFLDTLYHFKETLELKDRIAARYGVEIAVFKPFGVDTAAEFEKRYGERLWEKDDESYDYLVKVSVVVSVNNPVESASLNLSLILRPSGGASAKSVQDAQRPSRHHRPSFIPRRRAIDPTTARSRLHRYDKTQPLLRMEVLRRQGVHRRERRAPQRTP